MIDPAAQTLREVARRSRVRSVRVALVSTLVLAGGAYAITDAIAAEGVLLGGIAGALGYWAMSLRMERIALIKPERLQVATTIWTYYRLAIYAGFLFIAYRLDTHELHGLLGGIAGLLSTRFAVTFLAIRDSRTVKKPGMRN